MDGILIINKPKNMTSFDVVKHISKKLSVKAGHSGTLDPNATGVLVIALNKATKALPYLSLEEKRYKATLQLGIKTDTGDIWGNTLETRSPITFTKNQLDTVLNSFIKKQSQRIPKMSAKKIKGKKLYEYYHENVEVETLYKEIEIFKLDLIDFNDQSITFEALVSEGTYIRTLCEDIAERLGTIGTMSKLQRTQVGLFEIDMAIELEDLEGKDISLLNVKDVLQIERIVDLNLEFNVKNGQRLNLDITQDKILIDTGEYFAIYEREDGSIFKCVRGLW